LVGRLRQEDRDFKAILGYTARLSKTKNKKRKRPDIYFI
jgi:hypothetical protein